MRLPSDLQGVVAVQRTLLEADAHPDASSWAKAAGQALCALVGGSTAVVSVGLPGGHSVVVSDALSARDLGDYAREFATDDAAGALVLSRPECSYVEEDFEGHPAFQRHLRSAAYQDWYRPHGLVDTVGLIVTGKRTLAPEFYAVPVVANVLVAGTAMCRGAGAERARVMLALLQPAFEAGARAWQAPAEPDLVDALDVVAWLYGPSGACVHASASVARLGAARARVRAAADGLARRALAALNAGEVVSVAVEGASLGRVRLTATLLRATRPGDAALVVRAVGVPPSLPDDAALRTRFALTPRQIHVARLRSEGVATADIAARLCVSVHTVRRHTEQVMAKLDVQRAAEIGPRLLG